MLKVGVSSVNKEFQRDFIQALTPWVSQVLEGSNVSTETVSALDTDLSIDYNLRLKELLAEENFENQKLWSEVFSLARDLWKHGLEKVSTTASDMSICFIEDFPVQFLYDMISLLLANPQCDAEFFSQQTSKVKEFLKEAEKLLIHYPIQSRPSLSIFCVLPREFFARLTARSTPLEARFNIVRNAIPKLVYHLMERDEVNLVLVDTIDYLTGRFALRKLLEKATSLTERLSQGLFIVKVPEVAPEVFSFISEKICELVALDESAPPSPPFDTGVGGFWIP